MMNLLLTLAVFVVNIMGSLGEVVPVAPDIPEQFITRVEAVITAKSYSMYGDEYYDYKNQRSRFDFNAPHYGPHTVLLFGPNSPKLPGITPGYSYHINVTHSGDYACEKSKLQGDEFDTDSQGNLKSSGNLFRYSKQGLNYVETKRNIRGIPANVYETHVSETKKDSGKDVDLNFKIDWFFNKEGWSLADKMDGHFDNNKDIVPLRIVVKGSYTKDKKTTQFENFYDYTSFRVVEPTESFFTIVRDEGHGCVVTENYDHFHSPSGAFVAPHGPKSCAGLGWGMWFLGVFCGVGSIVGWVWYNTHYRSTSGSYMPLNG
eukprot:Clim_evm36s204 gene=Clim_evmTU36s204